MYESYFSHNYLILYEISYNYLILYEISYKSLILLYITSGGRRILYIRFRAILGVFLNPCARHIFLDVTNVTKH